MDPSSILVIVNPAAGRGRGADQARALKRELWRVGRRCEVAVSRSLAHVAALVRYAAGRETVVAIGGDGTMGAVVDALARLPETRRPRLAVFPAGTGNGFALRAAPSDDPALAAARIASGRTRSIRVGYVPDVDRHFALAVAIGWAARVIGHASQTDKKRYGKLAYLAHGVRDFARSPEAEVELLGESLRAHTVLITSAPLEVPMLSFDDWSEPDALDVLAIRGRTPATALRSFVALVRADARSDAVTRRRAERLIVRAEPALPVQVDGEPAGETPITVELSSARLRVCAE